jgi:hypothetical protein
MDALQGVQEGNVITEQVIELNEGDPLYWMEQENAEIEGRQEGVPPATEE